MTQDSFKAQGNDAFKAQKFQEAIDWYSKAINCDPNSEAAAALYSNRAASYSSLKNHQKALEDAEACVRIRPDWLKGHFRKGVALQALDRYDEAEKAYKQCLTCEPNNGDVQEKLNAVRSVLKDRNDKMSPNRCKTAEEAKQVGNSFFQTGKYDLAAEYYSRAIDLEPSENQEKANYYANRAACHQQVHNYKQVISDASQALAIVPNHVKALMRRAIAYEGLEKWQQALDDYNACNMLSPGISNVSQGVVRCQRALRSQI